MKGMERTLRTLFRRPRGSPPAAVTIQTNAQLQPAHARQQREKVRSFIF
jgi:hypothetical protein